MRRIESGRCNLRRLQAPGTVASCRPGPTGLDPAGSPFLDGQSIQELRRHLRSGYPPFAHPPHFARRPEYPGTVETLAVGYFTTMFTSLSGTTTILTICLPSTNGFTFSSASAPLPALPSACRRAPQAAAQLAVDLHHDLGFVFLRQFRIVSAATARGIPGLCGRAPPTFPAPGRARTAPAAASAFPAPAARAAPERSCLFGVQLVDQLHDHRDARC